MSARFLALGDSYTIGEGVAEGERWPALLVSRLRNEGIAIGDPQIIARTGWTTGELMSAMLREYEAPFALVTLLIGVNNQYRGRPPDEYRAQFRALLGCAIALTIDIDPRRVIVVSIPDWGVTPFARDEGRDVNAIAEQIDAFNRVAHEEAGMRNARFVDITPISRAPSLRGLLTADGLHPSGAQYARWVDAIAPVARSIFTHRHA